MAWTKLPSNLGMNPYIRKAARAAKTPVPAMIGHILLIWDWAEKFAPDRNVTDFDAWVLEDAAMWPGSENELFYALCDAEIIYFDEEEGGFFLGESWGSA